MSSSGKDHSVRAAAQSLIRAIARFETDKDTVALRRGIVNRPSRCSNAAICFRWVASDKPITSTTRDTCITTAACR